MRTIPRSHVPDRNEMLALRILQGAKDRSLLPQGASNPVMILRVSRFVEILKTAPHLIHYERDWAASSPQYPRYVAKFEDCIIKFSEAAL